MESCKEPWVENGDHCYYWSMMEANWTQAEDYCRSGGGHLASVTSNATNEFILRELNKRGNTMLWIGGTDKGEQGVWNCSPWDFEYWAEKQPSQHSKDDCVRYSKKITKGSTPKWNDWRCDHKHCFVCSQKLCPGDFNHLRYASFLQHIIPGSNSKTLPSTPLSPATIPTDLGIINLFISM